jgi:parvulin-like peptidyl-prolyl isomerase
MTVRQWRILGCGLAALFAASLVVYVTSSHQSPVPVAKQQDAETVSVAPPQPSKKRAGAPAPVIQVSATGVLASVNGRQLKLADLMPLSPAKTNHEQALSPETYHYLLERAINRELVLQTAERQGVQLDQAQLAQLDEFRKQRNQREPGLVQRLNTDSDQLDFETRDTEAFMLQTALLARTGASPNVTAEDALEYYSQHASDFAELPPSEPALSQAWANIDFQIRTILAPMKRANFQTQLAAYMDQIKSAADIALTPVAPSSIEQ